MPIIKSAKKRLRQSKKRRARNMARKTAMKKTLKQTRAFLLEGKTEEVKALLPQASKVLDKAAKAGVIKKQTASRVKSRLMGALRRAGK